MSNEKLLKNTKQWSKDKLLSQAVFALLDSDEKIAANPHLQAFAENLSKQSNLNISIAGHEEHHRLSRNFTDTNSAKERIAPDCILAYAGSYNSILYAEVEGGNQAALNKKLLDHLINYKSILQKLKQLVDGCRELNPDGTPGDKVWPELLPLKDALDIFVTDNRYPMRREITYWLSGRIQHDKVYEPSNLKLCRELFNSIIFIIGDYRVGEMNVSLLSDNGTQEFQDYLLELFTKKVQLAQLLMQRHQPLMIEGGSEQQDFDHKHDKIQVGLDTTCKILKNIAIIRDYARESGDDHETLFRAPNAVDLLRAKDSEQNQSLKTLLDEIIALHFDGDHSAGMLYFGVPKYNAVKKAIAILPGSENIRSFLDKNDQLRELVLKISNDPNLERQLEIFINTYDLSFQDEQGMDVQLKPRIAAQLLEAGSARVLRSSGKHIDDGQEKKEEEGDDTTESSFNPVSAKTELQNLESKYKDLSSSSVEIEKLVEDLKQLNNLDDLARFIDFVSEEVRNKGTPKEKNTWNTCLQAARVHGLELMRSEIESKRFNPKERGELKARYREKTVFSCHRNTSFFYGAWGRTKAQQKIDQMGEGYCKQFRAIFSGP